MSASISESRFGLGGGVGLGGIATIVALGALSSEAVASFTNSPLTLLSSSFSSFSMKSNSPPILNASIAEGALDDLLAGALEEDFLDLSDDELSLSEEPNLPDMEAKSLLLPIVGPEKGESPTELSSLLFFSELFEPSSLRRIFFFRLSAITSQNLESRCSILSYALAVIGCPGLDSLDTVPVALRLAASLCISVLFSSISRSGSSPDSKCLEAMEASHASNIISRKKSSLNLLSLHAPSSCAFVRRKTFGGIYPVWNAARNMDTRCPFRVK
mmetsp:Transcript_1494/g.2033  ORF Transcript_1494/g.2033 Transcript_1494/m.2033 type:complete len:272 (+) Transcript_1494:576-1391(+)